jgi:hypothetical protein
MVGAAAAPAYVLTLTAAGVPFPAKSIRRMTLLPESATKRSVPLAVTPCGEEKSAAVPAPLA